MSVQEKFRLDGKVALITGGRGALAEAIAAGLAEAGCRLALASRRSEECEASAERIAARCGVEAFGLRCDVAREDEVAGAVDPPARRVAIVADDVAQEGQRLGGVDLGEQAGARPARAAPVGRAGQALVARGQRLVPGVAGGRAARHQPGVAGERHQIGGDDEDVGHQPPVPKIRISSIAGVTSSCS